ncbi:MAG: serine hydrolase [Novosphingobium sp.]
MAASLAGASAANAQTASFETQFDKAYGTTVRVPLLVAPSLAQPVAAQLPRAYSSHLEALVASLADPAQGRIGVAAVELSSGRTVAVLGNQAFPMASTSKIAIVATFLDGVDRGRWRLSDQFPLMVPLPSAKFSSRVAPVKQGAMLSAQYLIERTIVNSDNQATDALLAAVGGPQAVNRWMRQTTGIAEFRLDRDIATLVRDDGAVNPAVTVDSRDSITPLGMTRLLAGLYKGEWLSASSRAVLIGAMERCRTGKRRLPGQLPENAWIAHKTGTLSNTSSDVGIIRTPDGRAFAVAVYVTGQGGKAGRDAKIAALGRVLYDGYLAGSGAATFAASR